MDRTLNVAIATETILYAPFYTAWFGSDFDKTPFGDVKINVIAREKDSTFRNDVFKNLKAVDGFVSLCLVFGYADVGICDPSFIIQACKTQNDPLLKTVFNEFFDALSEIEQETFKKNNSSIFNGNEIILAALKKEICSKTIKIVGNVISKVAFSVIGNQDIKTVLTGSAPYLGEVHYCEPLGTFGKNIVKKIIYFPEPSTGYCIGEGYRLAFETGKLPQAIKLEYGKEIDKILNLEDSESMNTIALTCDFISLDYINAKGIDIKERDKNGEIVYEDLQDEEGKAIIDTHGKTVPDKTKPKYKKTKQKIHEIEDWVINRNKTAMFTGILAVDPKGEKIELIRAFLYALDKNLYFLDKKIGEGKRKLSDYLTSKLDSQHPYLDEKTRLKLLIAYPEIEDNCSINDLIYHYVNRLTKWKTESSSLYYDKIEPRLNDLKEIYKIRIKAYPSASDNLTDADYNSFLEPRLLDEWKLVEGEIKMRRSHRIKKIFWHLFTDKSKLLYFGAAFISLEIISIILKLTNYHFMDIKPEGAAYEFIIGNYTYYVPWSLLAFVSFVLICYGTYNAVLKGQEINHLKEKEEFIFRD